MAITHAEADRLLAGVQRPSRAPIRERADRRHQSTDGQAELAPNRGGGSPAGMLLALQRKVGNAAVATMLQQSASSAPPRVQRCGGKDCATCRTGGDVESSPTDQVPQRITVQRGEKWDAFWGVGPIDAYRAKKLADEALSKASATGLPGLHNGPADAWRHAYWNCRMTAVIDADQAKEIADNHEKHGGGPAIENTMDQHNNAAGRSCSGNCDTCVQGKLDSGQLRIIDAGKLVPSTPTGRTPAGASKDDYDKY